MKFSFAVACLIGLVSADEPIWALLSVTDNAEDAKEVSSYVNYATEQSNKRIKDSTHLQVYDNLSSDDEEETNVQLNGDDSESDHSKEFYNAWDAVKDEEEGYHRALPAYFSGDGDDLFMRSMCKTYALEGKNKDGSPNGNFMMDEATTRAAASEVLETHKGLKGDEKKKYLDTYFARTFAHFDVTKGGKIEVIKMPQFMRFLASDQYMTLQN
jgi:hypothetical protein